MPKTLAELLDAPTATRLRTALLAALATAEANGGFPTLSWQDGSFPRTLVEGHSDAQAEQAATIALIAAGGLIELATGDWLTQRAADLYGLTRSAATHTIGTIKIYAATGSGPYSISANQLWFEGQGGNRYNSTSTGTLATPGFSSVTHVGAALGTVTPTADATIPTGRQRASANGVSYKVLIVTGGTIGTATYKLSLDGGTTYGDEITTTAGTGISVADPETGVILTFADAGGDFDSGDTYAFTAGGQLAVTVSSEYANDSTDNKNYVDANQTITRLLTPLPGVTASNFPATFSAVALSGSGTGTIVPAAKVDAGLVSDGSYEIEILSNGQVAAATFRYRVNGGSWSGSLLSAATYTDGTLDGYGFVLKFANGASNPSFVDGEFYSFTAPASWITTQGTDEESDDTLRTRSRGQWALLSPNLTDDAYEVLALDASDEVTRVKVATSSTVMNRIEITIAGQGGAVAAGVVNDVQTYINARNPLTDIPVVASATAQAITLSAGTVRVKAANLTSAQTAAQQNVANYLAQVDIGGTVRLNQVIEAILRDSGGEDDDCTALQINGAAANLALTALQVPTWTQVISTALTWTTY